MSIIAKEVSGDSVRAVYLSLSGIFDTTTTEIDLASIQSIINVSKETK